LTTTLQVWSFTG